MVGQEVIVLNRKRMEIRLDIREKFFTLRVVRLWNELSEVLRAWKHFPNSGSVGGDE